MAGTATVPNDAIGIANATFAIAGAAAVSAVGVGIISANLASAGAASVSAVGLAFATTVFTAAGVAAAGFVKGVGQITSTNFIQKPVDYALAGEQDKSSRLRRGRPSFNALRHIFRE